MHLLLQPFTRVPLSFSELQTSETSFQALPSPGAWSEGKEWKFKTNSKQNQALLCVHIHTCLEVPQLILLSVFCSIWSYYFFLLFVFPHLGNKKNKGSVEKIYIFLEKKNLLHKECFVLCHGPAQLSNSRFNRWGRLVMLPSRCWSGGWLETILTTKFEVSSNK